MPPIDYRLMHKEARLSPEEKQALLRGLDALRGSSSVKAEGGGERNGDD